MLQMDLPLSRFLLRHVFSNLERTIGKNLALHMCLIIMELEAKENKGKLEVLRFEPAL